MQIRVKKGICAPINSIRNVYLKLKETNDEVGFIYVIERTPGFPAYHLTFQETDVFLYERHPGKFLVGQKTESSYGYLDSDSCEEIYPENNKQASLLLEQEY